MRVWAQAGTFSSLSPDEPEVMSSRLFCVMRPPGFSSLGEEGLAATDSVFSTTLPSVPICLLRDGRYEYSQKETEGELEFAMAPTI